MLGCHSGGGLRPESERVKRRMIVMRSRWLVAAVVVGVGMALLGAAALWAQDDDYEGPSSNMHFLVLRDYNGKPVKNAAVVLHPVTRAGKQAMGGMELKTDDDGKTGIEGIPYGPLRVQVLAPGFQTFGEDYQVNRAEMVITIKLKRPASQVTGYGVQEAKKPDDKKASDSAAGNNSNAANNNKKTDDSKAPDPKPQQ